MQQQHTLRCIVPLKSATQDKSKQVRIKPNELGQNKIKVKVK